MIVVVTDLLSFCEEIADMEDDPSITDLVWVTMTDGRRARVPREQVRVLSDAMVLSGNVLAQVLP